MKALHRHQRACWSRRLRFLLPFHFRLNLPLKCAAFSDFISMPLCVCVHMCIVSTSSWLSNNISTYSRYSCTLSIRQLCNCSWGMAQLEGSWVVLYSRLRIFVIFKTRTVQTERKCRPKCWTCEYTRTHTHTHTHTYVKVCNSTCWLFSSSSNWNVAQINKCYWHCLQHSREYLKLLTVSLSVTCGRSKLDCILQPTRFNFRLNRLKKRDQFEP